MTMTKFRFLILNSYLKFNFQYHFYFSFKIVLLFFSGFNDVTPRTAREVGDPIVDDSCATIGGIATDEVVGNEQCECDDGNIFISYFKLPSQIQYQFFILN